MDLIQQLVKPFKPRRVPSELAVVALLFRGRFRRNMCCLTAVHGEAASDCQSASSAKGYRSRAWASRLGSMGDFRRQIALELSAWCCVRSRQPSIIRGHWASYPLTTGPIGSLGRFRRKVPSGTCVRSYLGLTFLVRLSDSLMKSGRMSAASVSPCREGFPGDGVG